MRPAAGRRRERAASEAPPALNRAREVPEGWAREQEPSREPEPPEPERQVPGQQRPAHQEPEHPVPLEPAPLVPAPLERVRPARGPVAA